MGWFRAVPVQARFKMRVVPYSPSCWDSRHGTALVFVSYQHGPKYFVPCRALGRVKRSCRVLFRNGTVQVPALVASMQLTYCHEHGLPVNLKKKHCLPAAFIDYHRRRLDPPLDVHTDHRLTPPVGECEHRSWSLSFKSNPVPTK